MKRRSAAVHLVQFVGWRGRSSRQEHSCVVVVCLVVGVLEAASWPFWPPALTAVVGGWSAYAAAASTTRRVHDMDQRGAVWAAVNVILVAFFLTCWAVSLWVPARPFWVDIASLLGIYIGWLPVLLLLLPLQPTRGVNRFGPIPPWTKPAELRREATPADIDRIRQRVRRGRRVALALRPAQRPTQSKLGGAPWLDSTIDWPRTGDGRPLNFLAQLDLSETRAAGGPRWLPASGVIFFFADEDLGALQARAIFCAEGAADFPRPPATRLFGERKVILVQETSDPSLEWLGISAQFDGDEAEALMRSIGAKPSRSGHRIGGYPAEIQDTPLALACELAARGEDMFKAYPNPDDLYAANLAARRRWRLLLQIETDEALGMRFGDGGRLWFFVREADARRGDFSRARAIVETY